MKKCFAVFFVLFLFVLAACGKKSESTGGVESGAINLLSVVPDAVSDWYSGWENAPNEVVISKIPAGVKITGRLINRSFAAAHKNLTVDLDKNPSVEIEIAEVSNHWFLIASGGEIPGGWVKLQEDSNGIGKFKYDLKTLSALKGLQSFDLQVGVAAPGTESADGLTVTVKSLSLVK